MVLQRNEPIKIWGWATIGENIKVNFNGKKRTAATASDGTWEVMFPPMKAGGPYAMKINEIELKDVLIGDVWLCAGAGQSNMVH